MSMTRGQMQDLLMQFSVENPNYRKALIEDPKSVLEKQFGNALPAGMAVEAKVETAEKAYVIVPHVAEEGELDDADLEKVAGGLGDKYEANCGGGVLNTLNQVSL